MSSFSRKFQLLKSLQTVPAQSEFTVKKNISIEMPALEQVYTISPSKSSHGLVYMENDKKLLLRTSTFNFNDSKNMLVSKPSYGVELSFSNSLATLCTVLSCSGIDNAEIKVTKSCEGKSEDADNVFLRCNTAKDFHEALLGLTEPTDFTRNILCVKKDLKLTYGNLTPDESMLDVGPCFTFKSKQLLLEFFSDDPLSKIDYLEKFTHQSDLIAYFRLLGFIHGQVELNNTSNKAIWESILAIQDAVGNELEWVKYP